jgi:hypothetical protein
VDEQTHHHTAAVILALTFLVWLQGRFENSSRHDVATGAASGGLRHPASNLQHLLLLDVLHY